MNLQQTPPIVESWSDIPGYEGIYQISDLGRVKSLPRTAKNRGGQRVVKERIMKGTPKENDYLIVRLRKEAKPRTFYIHRLVAFAFVPNPDNLPEVDHIFGDKADNRAIVLRWTNRADNIKNSYRLGIHKPVRGTLSTKAKLTDEAAGQIKKLYAAGGTSHRKLAAIYKVHHSVIAGIVAGTRWPHVA